MRLYRNNFSAIKIRLLPIYCNGTELPRPTCMMTTTVHVRSTEKRTNFLTRPPNVCQRLVRKEQLTAMANLSMLADRLLGGHTMFTSLPRRAGTLIVGVQAVSCCGCSRFECLSQQRKPHIAFPLSSLRPRMLSKHYMKSCRVYWNVNSRPSIK
jgi:hypothetical protein